MILHKKELMTTRNLADKTVFFGVYAPNRKRAWHEVENAVHLVIADEVARNLDRVAWNEDT